MSIEIIFFIKVRKWSPYSLGEGLAMKGTSNHFSCLTGQYIAE